MLLKKHTCPVVVIFPENKEKPKKEPNPDYPSLILPFPASLPSLLKSEKEKKKDTFPVPPLPRIFPFVIDETREKPLNRQCVLFRWIYIGVFACVCMNVYGGGGLYHCGIK